MTRLSRRPMHALVLGAMLSAWGIPGCGGGPAAEPGKPIPIANPSADNTLKEVTLDNESENMKVLKEKTKTGPAPKALGPELPGMPK